MGCDISSDQLWSWVDREAPELTNHLVECASCRQRTELIRRKMRVIAAGSSVVIPDKVGPYTIKNLLGEGGQALVYEAEQPGLGRVVALKVLKGGRFAGDRLIKHFRRECETLAKFRHPGIATIYDAGHTDEGLHYFAMEKVEGVPLGVHVREHDLTFEERLDLFLEICEAVAYAHEKGVIHLDLKPSNIIVDPDGCPRILDFGIARMTRSETRPDKTLTTNRTGLIAGTPRYMSPEQARGQVKQIDARSDVYTLGVILYELLAGRPPQEIDELTPETLLALNERTPDKPSSHDHSVDSELDTITLKAIEKAPERRYDAVTDLAGDIRRFRNTEPILARPPSIGYRLRKAIYRNRRRIGITVVVALALATALFSLWPDTPKSYDVDRARFELLRLRSELLQGTVDQTVFSRVEEAAQEFAALPEANLVRSLAVYRERDPLVASVFLESRLEIHPDQWPYRLLLAEIRGREPESFEDTPDSAENWYLRSIATLDLQQALALAAESVKRDPDHIPALANLALLSAIAGDVEGALGWATELANKTDHDEYWINFKIELLFSHSRFEEAFVETGWLLEANPGTRFIHLKRGRILRRLKRYEEAVLEYTAAIDAATLIGPSSTWLYYHRGTMYWILERDKEAIADYDRVFHSLAHSSFANVRLFFIQHQLGQSEAAIRGLEDARRKVGADPWLATILSCLAGELTPSELVSAAETPVQLCEAYYYAGEVSLLQGDRESATSWFQACVGTGLESDPSEFWEPMSEYELAQWRLGP